MLVGDYVEELENLFWQVLEEIGARDGLSIGQLITRLYEELAEAGGDCGNFSSFLRVSCGRYLALQVSGRIPAGTAVPIRLLDADWVLAGEKRALPDAFPMPSQHRGMAQARR